MRDNESSLLPWVGGILAGLVLIFLTTLGGSANTTALQRHFAPNPNSPTSQPFQLPIISLPNLSPEMQARIADLSDRLALGQAVPALTPVASSSRIRVEIQQIKRNGENVQISGTLHNIASSSVDVGLSAFSFRDSLGTSYAASGGSTTLQPGQSTTLDLSLGLPNGRGLTMIFNLPPDPPVEQVLILETTP